MASGTGSGGGRRNGNSDRNQNNFGKNFSHELHNPSRAQYPPRNSFAVSANPDDLIRDIPFPAQAIGDFHSVPANSPPHRDIPSILIAHIGNPDTSLVEPNWAQLLHYFRTDYALQGVGNLQDLYMFLTRIALPNAIITNRRLLLDFYVTNRNAPPNIRLRYDAWTGTDYIPLDQEPPISPSIRLYNPRPILRSALTPNGTNLVQWLNTPPNTPPPHIHVPVQLRHRGTQLDLYLEEDEMAVRRIHPSALLERTARVLHLFWGLVGCNSGLERYRLNGWVGMEREVDS
jgi:hypothetical protein